MNIAFSFARRALALLVVALVAAPGLARAEASEPAEVEAQRLAHILGYVAADYGAAVEDGRVANEAEYAEQIALLADAAKVARRLAPAIRSAGANDRSAAPLALEAKLGEIERLVRAKAAATTVAAEANGLRSAVLATFRILEAPARKPNAMHGKSLWVEHCATCHGQSGRADTARAASLTPRPADFHDPDIGETLTPARVASTIRFGINGTAMVPFTFLSETDRWDLAFFVTGLRHAGATPTVAPAYAPSELAVRSDAQLRDELAAAGVPAGAIDGMLADLRRRAPYEDRVGRTPLALVRVKLERARAAVVRGERAEARGHLLDAYLEGLEPVEPALRAVAPALAAELEAGFASVRARLEAGEPPPAIEEGIATVLRATTRAETTLAGPPADRSFVGTALKSAGILLREGVEAALLVAALLGLAAQAGLADRKRWVHAGWALALALGIVTWLVSARIIAISGARREMVEGVTAVLAAAVLFYVSYSLIARREVARWMAFLRERVTRRRAAATLLGVSFLAAYREAFETVLFYQALLASGAPPSAAFVGAAGGAVVLVAIVLAYSRAGRFAPPQTFFRISGHLLYALTVVFAGQGIAALQATGVVPLHPVPGPTVPAIGLFPTVETLAVQLLLLGLAVVGWLAGRRASASPPPPRGTAPIPRPTVDDAAQATPAE